MSIKRGMDKEEVVHIYNGILLRHKKEQNWVICRDVIDLETVMQSEVSLKEKNKYHILMHICGIFKKMIQMNLFTKQTHRHRKQTWLLKGKGGGWVN